MKAFILSIVLYLGTVIQANNLYAQESYEINPDIQALVAAKADLIKELISEPTIVSQISVANSTNQKISLEEILKFDSVWKAEAGVGNFVRHYLTNPCSEKLLDFQDRHSEFAEIFVTDLKGLNVCQTNKTSDWYQADEDWWQKTWALGKGLSYSGQIEYDQSAHSESIPIFVPIFTVDKNKLIGVAKASLSVSSIKLRE